MQSAVLACGNADFFLTQQARNAKAVQEFAMEQATVPILQKLR